MADFKAVQLLRTLSKEDMKEFEKFVASPFFSTGRDLKPLLSYLKKYYPNFSNESALNSGAIHKALAGGTAKTKTDLTRKLLSDLFKQAEKFITIKHFINDKSRYGITKITALNNLETQVLFDKAVAGFRNENAVDKRFFPLGFLQNSELEDQLLNNYLKRENLKKYFSHFINSSDSRLLAAVSVLYRTSAAFPTFRKIYNYDPSGSLTDMLHEIINHEKLLDGIKKFYPAYYPFIETYYYLYMSLNNMDDLKYYYKFKDSFYANIKLYDHDEAYNLFKFLESYLIINKDILTNFKSENKAMHKEMLNNNIYSLTALGNMFVSTYLNFCFSFINNDDVEYAEEFVKSYNKELEQKFRKNIFLLATAFILAEKKEYENALRHLSKVKKDGSFEIRHLHHLSIRLHYELSNFESALNAMDTFEKFLRSSTGISDSARNRELNYTRILKKIINCKLNYTKRGLEEIIYEISASKPIYNPLWLKEKAEEIKK